MSLDQRSRHTLVPAWRRLRPGDRVSVLVTTDVVNGTLRTKRVRAIVVAVDPRPRLLFVDIRGELRWVPARYSRKL